MLKHKKHKNTKQVIFTLSKVFIRAKDVALDVICSLIFVILSVF